MKAARQAPIIGDGAWHLTFAISIFFGKLARIFYGMTRVGMTSGAPGMGPNGGVLTIIYRKHDMRWVLWYPTFLATPESKVAQQHPDWMIPGQDTLEQSIPATADWQTRLLDDGVSAWGDFQWRYDIAPAASANDTDASRRRSKLSGIASAIQERSSPKRDRCM